MMDKPDNSNVSKDTKPFDLAAGIQAQLAQNVIKTGELEKRASAMGLGMGGGLNAWKRMTAGLVWDNDQLKEAEEEEDEMTPEEEEAYRAKVRAEAMAKLMGGTELKAVEEEEEEVSAKC